MNADWNALICVHPRSSAVPILCRRRRRRWQAAFFQQDVEDRLALGLIAQPHGLGEDAAQAGLLGRAVDELIADRVDEAVALLGQFLLEAVGHPPVDRRADDESRADADDGPRGPGERAERSAAPRAAG